MTRPEEPGQAGPPARAAVTAMSGMVDMIERVELELAADPNNAAAIAQAGHIAIRLRDYARAAQFFDRALDLDPNLTEALSGMSSALVAQGRQAELIPLVRGAIERRPHNAALWREMSRIVGSIGDRENALVFLDEACRLSPGNVDLLIERGNLRREAGLMRDAIGDFDAALALAPLNVKALLHRGDAELAVAQVDKARETYLQALPRVADPQPVLDRLQRAGIMEFHADLARSSRSQPFPEAEKQPPLHIVFFHADAETHGVAMGSAIDYIDLLTHAAAVARAKAPRAKIVLLTDADTRFPQRLQIDQLVRGDVRRDELMRARMVRQRAYLSELDDANVLFLDSDVLVAQDPAPIFAENFDVALTYRNTVPEAPFNGGVIFARAGADARRFFDHALSSYAALERFPAVAARFPDGIRRWWGDQLALAAVVGWECFAKRAGDRLSVDGIRVRCLPDQTYNRVLDAAMPADLVDLSRTFLVHFKGDRKHAAAAVAARLLQGG